MYFHWKKEHKIERMSITTVERPTVSMMISADKCLLRRRRYAHEIDVYDVISKSDVSLTKNLEGSPYAKVDAGATDA
ncbi:jg19028 [Pararge aegeria aegeria]|uniref:Jg19028 protein n=1 Tax=Pararge aegeria aegeria TaxID=348720 RepID=A0A8S4R814_9NEOP|nr:jg19028 [Pararge aegeria aegeria]